MKTFYYPKRYGRYDFIFFIIILIIGISFIIYDYNVVLLKRENIQYNKYYNINVNEVKLDRGILLNNCYWFSLQYEKNKQQLFIEIDIEPPFIFIKPKNDSICYFIKNDDTLTYYLSPKF
jgi:hypothetical protein